MTTSTVTIPTGQAERQASRGVLIATLLALFLAAMDSTVIGTILPEIKRSLPGAELYPWVVSGFILATVLTAPLAGRAADVLGTRKTFLGFIVVFMAGSVGAGLVSTMGELVAARVVQGVGAGGISVLTYVTFAQLFEPEKRAKMQGLLSAVWGIAAVLGPAVSSVVTRQWGWIWVFLMNIPLCLIAAAMLRSLPVDPPLVPGRRLDVPGLAFVSVGILSSLLLVMLPTGSRDGRVVVGLCVVAVVCLGSFVRHLRAHPRDSVLDIAFFSDSRLRAQSVLVLVSALVMYTSVTLVPQYLQEVRHETVVQSGFVVMFAAIGWVVGATLGGGALTKLGFKTINAMGLLSLLCGVGLLTVFDEQTNIVIGYASQAFIGAGIGQISIASLLLAQQSLPAERVGVATANVQLLRNLGAVFGVNVFATLAMGPNGYQASFFGMLAVTLLGAPWILAIPRAVSLPMVDGAAP